MIKARGLKYLNKFLLLSIIGIRKEGMVQWHLPKEVGEPTDDSCVVHSQYLWNEATITMGQKEAEIPRICEHPICR